MSLSKQEALRLAKICFSSESTTVSAISSISTIARLWGGMGQIYRVVVVVGDSDETKKKKNTNQKNISFCVKYMAPRLRKHGKHGMSRGDQRKLDSYTVEANFYQYYSQQLLDQGVGLATCLHVEQQQEQEVSKTILCLSILDHVPSYIHHDDYFDQTLEWLAHFHASTWQHGFHNDCYDDRPDLQPNGTYWHLDTRPDEWHAMSSKQGSLEGRLKMAAPAIDGFLKYDGGKGTSTTIQSWVHGDAKDANVMWDGTKIAFCDFQYVGPGCPAKDVCYFLCSSGVADNDEYVHIYFRKLSTKLIAKGLTPPLRHHFDAVIELAYADYLRFMFGWGQWGSNITKRVETTLDKLDGGTVLKSEDAYREAIQKVFGE